MSTPVTPCDPGATVAFVERRFGCDLSKRLHPTCRLAVIRGNRITELRRRRELRHAERFGWLSLAGWLLGMKASRVARLDPSSDAINHRARNRDVLPEPLSEDIAPDLVPVGDTGLEVSDPRDPLGYHLVELAAAACHDGLIELYGRRLGPGAVAASLRARLEQAAHG